MSKPILTPDKPTAPVPTFTPQQAQALIAVARSAPIGNMDEAAARQQLFQVFGEWYAHVQGAK